MKTLVVLIAVALVLVVASDARKAGPPKWHQLSTDYTFEQFVQDFQKPHTPGSAEWSHRKTIFEASLKRAIMHNADGTQTYKKGVNQFSDLTREEARQQTLMFREVGDQINPDAALISEDQHRALLARKVAPPASARDTVDWRLSVPPVLTTVKDQGICGGCWSFGTTEGIESQYALQYGELHVLSEQQLISCAPTVNFTLTIDGVNQTLPMGGCNGYLANLAVEYLVKQGGGMTSEWINPFTAYFNQDPYHPVPLAKCSTRRVRNFVNVTGYNFIPSNDFEAFKRTLQEVGPVTILMYFPNTMFDFETGIYGGKQCVGNNGMVPNHVVLLVGYGHDAELQKDYWIIRNSWSSMWGEDGYFRLLREDSEPAFNAACGRMPIPETDKNGNFAWFPNRTACGPCGILTYGLVPTVSHV